MLTLEQSDIFNEGFNPSRLTLTLCVRFQVKRNKLEVKPKGKPRVLFIWAETVNVKLHKL